MRRNTVLCRLVHFVSTDLDLKRLSAAADQRCVQGLIHIGLWHGNIILKPARDGLIHLMDHSQGCIAVLYGIHNDPHGKQIIDLVYGLILVFHFLIDAEKMLYSSVDLGFDPGISDMLTDLIHNILDVFFPDAFTDSNLVHQVIVSLRFQIFQGKVIQFYFNLRNSKSLRNRRIDFNGFPCNPLLAFRLLIF